LSNKLIYVAKKSDGRGCRGHIIRQACRCFRQLSKLSSKHHQPRGIGLTLEAANTTGDPCKHDPVAKRQFQPSSITSEVEFGQNGVCIHELLAFGSFSYIRCLRGGVRWKCGLIISLRSPEVPCFADELMQGNLKPSNGESILDWLKALWNSELVNHTPPFIVLSAC